MSAVRDSGPAPGRKVLRAGPAAWTFRPRVVAVPLVGAALLVVVAAVNIGKGSSYIEPLDVLRTLLGGGDRRETGIIFDLRLPRTLAGVLVGAAFGLAGAIFQTIARNPLASPDILGITWGAGVGAVGVIVVGGYRGQVSGAAAELGVPLAALVGGLVAGLLLYALSWRRGIDGYRMVLVGIGLSAIGYNIVYWLLTVGDVDDAARATTWIVGNLADVGWEAVGPVALALAVLVPVTLVGAHTLGGLQFGDDTARGLGIRVDAARGGLLLLAAALAAVATAAAGPITFVALATPQIALRLARTAQPPLAGSMVLGALLTVGADLTLRLTAPALPVGVLTAILGAPYLIYLFVRSRREVRA
ncbi:iron complex transport system permease protein [Prauserella shujinwangii]|uniref:Iron complex transport system permease protein n=1 Tax=Prauserella shujinwangii TaxID=1453103 RepID=A0A2T0LQ44_9PSEU|nr:iron chelate uptake ABC transporter family permease subunit [Prauserella shujinwangii]PRX45477.1 iron complex transport system permease protein [Prauserella shujinwangii]